MVISVRLEPEVEARLNHLVAITGRTKSYYLREFIQMGLEDLEYFYLADAVMERIHQGQEVIHSSDEVREKLGLNN